MPSLSRILLAGSVMGLLMAAVVFLPESASNAAAQPPATPKPDETFKTRIQPFLAKYCNTCHNTDKNAGGIALDIYTSEAHARKDRKTWLDIAHQLSSGEMPPKKKEQPGKDERQFVIEWIQNALTKVDCTGPQNPGRVTIRRLNRAEYNNTIRDLCGVTIQPGNDFPADDVGYGFDNIGDVLSVQPILLEKYLAAADRILDATIPPLDRIPQSKNTVRPQNLQAVPRDAKIREKDSRGRDINRIMLTTEGSVFIDKLNFPADGDYVIRIRAWGKKAGDEYPKMVVRIAGQDIYTTTVDATPEKRQEYEKRVRVTSGEKRVAVSLLNPFTEKAPDPKPEDDDPKKRSRQLGIDVIEVEGPMGGADRPLSAAVKRVLVTRPANPSENQTAARQIIAEFARRAFRRPVKPEETDRLMKLFGLAESKGEKFEQAIKLPLKAVLVSPHFLFRIEDDPKAPETVRTLNDFELATRLSYFLWSSMPDDELYRLAERNELHKSDVLLSQIKRMLKDDRSEALMMNFAGQWLQTRNLANVSPDTNRFPSWDEELRKAMVKETEMVFDHIVTEDRSILEFLDSNYTFLNERLARHYGIPNVRGRDFRKVTLPDGRRGGVVTHASILTHTSNPTRTSPVKRGKWVYENILGLTAPPPAPDVPELPPVGEIKGTLRQQMELHRSNPNCAKCHEKLDPLGFGLENFDAIGAWRAEENNVKIDASGILPDGAKFTGPAEMRKVLLAKSDLFRRCLAEKMLTYALGRGLEYYDKCVLDDIVGKLKTTGNDKFSALILAVVESDAFRKRAALRSE